MQVSIKCKQVVEYNQIVEMSEEDYEVLSNCGYEVSLRYNPKDFELLDKYINFDDVIDATDEFTDVEIYKCS